MKYTEFFTNEREIFLLWAKILGQNLVQTNFHEIFKVNHKLGKGSFSKVYQITHKKTKQIYACKLLNKKYILLQNNGVSALKNEMTIMKDLDHPNIVKNYFIHEYTLSVRYNISVLVYFHPKVIRKVISTLLEQKRVGGISTLRYCRYPK